MTSARRCRGRARADRRYHGGLRGTLREANEARVDTPVIWLCKGFEPGRARLPHEVCGGRADSSDSRRCAVGAELRAGSRRGLARCGDARFQTSRVRARCRPHAARPGASGVFERGLRRRRSCRRGEERDRDRRGNLRRAALRPQRARGADHAGTRGSHASRRRARRARRNVHGTRRRGRSHPHVHGRPFAQPQGGAEARTRPTAGRHPGRARSRRRGRQHRARARSIAEHLGIDMPITRAVCRVLDDHRQARAAAE